MVALSLLYKPLPCNWDSAGSGVEYSAVPHGWSSSLPLALRRLCHPLLRTGGEALREKCYIQLWKQKWCGKQLLKLNTQEIMFQFLENFAKTSLLGMRKPGLDCFWHKAGVRNWRHFLLLHPREWPLIFRRRNACLFLCFFLRREGYQHNPTFTLAPLTWVLMYAKGGTAIFLSQFLLHQATTCFAWGWSCLWSSPSSDTNKAECHSSCGFAY